MNRDIVKQQRGIQFEEAPNDKATEQKANQIKYNQTPTQSDAIQLQLLEMMKQMQAEITDLKKKSTGGAAETSTRSTKPPFVAKYCWSHGSCGHTSKDCTKRKDGHNEEATFKDKKGGRTWRCA